MWNDNLFSLVFAVKGWFIYLGKFIKYIYFLQINNTVLFKKITLKQSAAKDWH